MNDMSGYELNDEDIKGIMRWLEEHHPDDVSEEVAREMLLTLKLSVRGATEDEQYNMEEIYRTRKSN